MVGLLRRKRNPIEVHNSPSTASSTKRELSHSLSLPDLTTPLLDPSSWESIPDFPSILPSLPNSKSTTSVARAIFSSSASVNTRSNRSPSLVGGGVAFHKPFGQWQVVKHPDEMGEVPALMYKGDFRKSTWTARDSVHSFATQTQYGAAHQVRRRKKVRVAENLNVMIVGGKGVGKTSFLHLLKATPTSTELRPSTSNLSPPKLLATPSSPTSPGPPITPSSIDQISSPSPHSPNSNNRLQRPIPTSRISATSITLDRPTEKIQLNLIDTPGLNLKGDDGPALHARQRERGVQAILSIAEERFGDVLREESKVVRRQLSGGSGLVHLCIYVIDARVVLNPPEKEVEVDWSGLSFAESTTSAEIDGMEELQPKLGEVEVDIIRQLSQRMNVLPILTHTDALSINELEAVRQAVRRDLAEGFKDDEGKGFGIFGRDIEEEGSVAKTINHKLSTISDRTPPSSPDRPLTPISMNQQPPEAKLPYAIFSPAGGMVREYSWGMAEVAEHSDLESLRVAILDTHAKVLRSNTREVLYERYRTERLLDRRGKKEAVISVEV